MAVICHWAPLHWFQHVLDVLLTAVAWGRQLHLLCHQTLAISSLMDTLQLKQTEAAPICMMSPCYVRHAHFPQRRSILWDTAEPVFVDVALTCSNLSYVDVDLETAGFSVSHSTLVYLSVAMGGYSSALVPGKPYKCSANGSLLWKVPYILCLTLLLCCNACSPCFVFLIFFSKRQKSLTPSCQLQRSWMSR